MLLSKSIMSYTKFLYVFSIVLLISGCSKVVTQKDISAAESYCADREGTFKIAVTDSLWQATCKNGDKSKWAKVN